MKNRVSKIIFSVMGVFFSTVVFAATCLPIQGTVETQSIGSTEQIGVITMTSSSPSAFKKVFGGAVITGGINGTITIPTNTNGQTELVHQMGFPGVGSIISNNDVAQVMGVDSEGNLLVTETAPIRAMDIINATQNGGAFVGWDGQITAKGTLNPTTGSNIFIYSGKICRK